MLVPQKIGQPVEVGRLLTRYGMSLRKAHDALNRLADRNVAAVELRTSDHRKLCSELSRLGVKAYVIHTPNVDVKRVREGLGLSQAEFALRFGLELDTIQNWEQGRYKPDPAAQLLIKLIETHPEIVQSALISYSPVSNRAASAIRVAGLVEAAFIEAQRRYPAIHQRWVRISFEMYKLLPASNLMGSMQRDGHIDILLRSMEDESALRPQTDYEPGLFQSHYLKMISELWIGGVYETFRLLIDRKLAPNRVEFRHVAHDLRLLRIPLEKHEIAGDRRLAEPLQMRREPPNNDQTDAYLYSKDDPGRAHIMSSGLSHRGSLMWQVIDLENNETRWIERRVLSDTILELWNVDVASPREPPAN